MLTRLLFTSLSRTPRPLLLIPHRAFLDRLGLQSEHISQMVVAQKSTDVALWKEQMKK